MCPHGFVEYNLNESIKNVWIVKRDDICGRPWCRVVKHFSLNDTLCDVTFQDFDVNENDFYWIAIRQGGIDGSVKNTSFRIFLGPVFINQVS